jgi:uncharacterized membrane protein
MLVSRGPSRMIILAVVAFTFWTSYLDTGVLALAHSTLARILVVCFGFLFTTPFDR